MKIKAIVLHYFPQYKLKELESNGVLLAELYRYAQFLIQSGINTGGAYK